MLNRLNHPVYLISERADGHNFSFTTVHGVEYLVYFAEADGYVPSASFASHTRMLGFTPLRGTFREGERLPNDAAAWPTIFEILYLYMNRYPDTVLLYVCSDVGVWDSTKRHPRFAKKRSEVFAEKYELWQQTGVMPAVKIDYGLYGSLYCSCVFRSGNPYESEVRQVIHQTTLEKQ